MNLRFTLVGDGPSDMALIPIISRLVRHDVRVFEIESQFAEPALLPPAREGLAARLIAAMQLYPCDILFIHRDAEKESYDFRRAEIEKCLLEIVDAGVCVPVVPVRMTEAWLLFDEGAIRSAAGNPNGTADLLLPRIQDVEHTPDPKQILHEALISASERTGRARSKFNVRAAAVRIVDLIADFTPLEEVSSFRRLKEEVPRAIDRVQRIRRSSGT